MSDTNPETGVITDVESAVAHLTAPVEGKPEDEPEPVQEPDETEAEEVEATDDAEEVDEPEAEADESEPEEADEEPEDPKYTVKVNGEEFEVTLDELRNGYQMGADYHRKTAAVAEERRKVEAQQKQAEQLREQYEAALAKFVSAEDQEPDWVKLADELDPWQYQQRRAQWDVKQAEKARAAQQLQAAQAQRQQELIRRESQRLLEAFPEWKDSKAFQRDRADMLEVAKAYGYTEEEFMSAVDHRIFRMLRDATRGRKFASAKPAPTKKVAKPAPKALKPGAQTTSADRRSDKAAALRDNLRKRGDTDSAVAFLLGGG